MGNFQEEIIDDEVLNPLLRFSYSEISYYKDGQTKVIGIPYYNSLEYGEAIQALLDIKDYEGLEEFIKLMWDR